MLMNQILEETNQHSYKACTKTLILVLSLDRYLYVTKPKVYISGGKKASVCTDSFDDHQEPDLCSNILVVVNL